jgi:hypothetical protein
MPTGPDVPTGDVDVGGLQRDHNRCQLCDSTEHLTLYEPPSLGDYGQMLPEDQRITLCMACCREVSELLERRRKAHIALYTAVRRPDDCRPSA